MTDRRRRGARRSSNCFQTSSAFGFLAFIVRSRVGIRGVESFTSKRKDKDLTPRAGPDRIGIFDRGRLRAQGPKHGSHREKRSWQPATWDDQDQRGRGSTLRRGKARAGGMRRKKKGRKRGGAAVSPRIYYTRTKALCKH